MKVLLGQPQLLKLKPLTAIDAISARDTGRLGLNVLSGYPAITLFSASKLISHPAQNPVGTSSNEIKDIVEEAQTDEISKNLIYVSNDNKISHLMLEICNTKTNNMDYITIPVGTDYTIPTEMYQKLSIVNQEIPQIIRIGRLKQYFQNE